MLMKVLIFIPLYCVWVGAASYLAFGVFMADQPEGASPLPAVIAYLVAILIPVWLFIKWMYATPGWMGKVQAEGKQATATILNVKNTGMVINNTVAVVKLQLRVEPPDEAPFEVSLERQISLLSGLGGLHAGARLQVKYDPNNKKHVVILSHSDAAEAQDYRMKTGGARADAETAGLSRYEGGVAGGNAGGNAGSNSGSHVASDLAELAALHKRGDLSDAEFESAKKKLLG
jgi:hypothetical protein